MVIYGRLIKGHRTIYQRSVADTCVPASGFRDKLENCLIGFCKGADIPTPIWLSGNTSELAGFHKTSFFAEQFTETVGFDRFELKIVEI
jgi:hypothetical protein